MCIRDRGQIKMVQAMSALLEEYEREGYYRRSRQRYETRNVPSNDHHNNNGKNRPNFNNWTNHNNEMYKDVYKRQRPNRPVHTSNMDMAVKPLEQ